MPPLPPSSPKPESPEPSEAAPPESGRGRRSNGAVGVGSGPKEPPLAGQRWLWVGVLAALLGLAAVYAVLQSSRSQVPLVSSEQPVSSAEAAAQAVAAPQTEADAAADGSTLRALNLAVPTGFAPPTLSGLDFAAAFAEAAAYRGWSCREPQVVLFSDAHRAIPAVQAALLAQGYKVSDTSAALGEDQSWLAQHSTRPTLFGSFSSGPQGRGNISVCQVGLQ